MSNTKYRNSVWLKKYTLRNYNSIVDLEGEFKPGLNIIIGKNGAGKTNTLRFLNQVFDWDKHFFSFEECDLEFEAEEEQGVNGETSRIRRAYPCSKSTSKNFAKDSLGIIADSIVEFRFIPQRFGEKLPFLTEAVEFDTANSSEAYLAVSNAKAPWFIKNIFGKLILESSNDAKLESMNSKVGDLLKSRIEKIILQLEGVTDYCPIEDIRLSPKYSFREGGVKNSYSISGLILEFNIEGKWFGFKQLSDGTQRIFLLLAELELSPPVVIRADVGVTLPSDTKAPIFLIEEPELGIHPHQLHRLMEYLKERSEDSQIIISTHAPQVLNFLDQDELDRLVICTFSSEEGTRMRNLSDEEIDDAKQYMGDYELFLSDYWVHSNLEPEF